MTKRGRYLGKFVSLLPMNKWFYKFCLRYVNWYDNDNNAEMRKNGEMHWLQEVLGSCRLVFDVGANVGDWTEIALRINPHLRVHCFEPSAATFERLKSRPCMDERVVLNHL